MDEQQLLQLQDFNLLQVGEEINLGLIEVAKKSHKAKKGRK